MEKTIKEYQYALGSHPAYRSLKSIEAIKRFMEVHVFAVWDFMSLLKALQIKITNTNVPWKPSKYDVKLVRMINEIVLGEESDVDRDGVASSHFELYLKAMNEIGADTTSIKSFLTDYDFDRLPYAIRDFVATNLRVAMEGNVIEVASSFFYGREKLIPSMFEGILKVLKDENMDCPTLIYYLERHIEVDGDEHGPLANECLSLLIDNKIENKKIASDAALEALNKREKLWDYVAQINKDAKQIKSKKFQ